MRHLASVGRALLGAAALALVFVPLGGGAQAQTFPSKPIRLVLPYVPGGIIDNVGRHLAQRLGENLGEMQTAVQGSVDELRKEIYSKLTYKKAN